VVYEVARRRRLARGIREAAAAEGRAGRTAEAADATDADAPDADAALEPGGDA